MSFSNSEKRLKAILVGIPLPGTSDADNAASLAELGRLVHTLGYDVVHTMSQRRSSHAGGTLLGDGKLVELAKHTGGTGKVKKAAFRKKTKAAMRSEAESEEENKTDEADDTNDLDESEADENSDTESTEKIKAEVIVFDCDMSPSQLVNIQSATQAEVLDRTGVIVEIFNRHAKTREARLQVEIARLNYLAPRLRETGSGGDRIGTTGETSLELDKRKIRDRIAELRRELAAVQVTDGQRRQKRNQQNCVALVGYTNAGKSSLMRALTGSEVLVADKLFATLDTTVRALYPESQPRILVSDTVGFIKKLPHDLVASFRSTLEEASQASLLLFVVDCSDDSFRSQLEVTHQVLSEIGVEGIPSLLILNKTDAVSQEKIDELHIEFPDAFFMSTRNSADVAQLRERIISSFEEDMIEEELLVPYSVQGIVGEIRSSMRVLSENYNEDGAIYKVRAPTSVIQKIKQKFNLV